MSIKFPKRTKKTPKKMRFVGMEIECITTKAWEAGSSEDDDDFYSDDSYYEKECLGRAQKFVLNIHDDGSVEGDGYPAEVVTQPLLENRKSAMRSLCSTIKKRGGYVNKTCGGHIHVDAKDFLDLSKSETHIENAIKFLTLCEPALYAVTGKGRINNSFCQPLHLFEPYTRSGEITKKWDTSRLLNDRYWSINLYAIQAHGTIEFRLFSGTLEHEKWIARAAICEAIVNKLGDCLKNPKLIEKFHKKSLLKSVDLDNFINGETNKKPLYKDIIKNSGPELISNVAKFVGLNSRHTKVLIKQHLEIWEKYEKLEAA